MSTPQGPNPPHDQPADQPAWGQQPPGGWGQQQGDQDQDGEQTRVVRPQGAGQQGEPQGGQQPPPAWAQQNPYPPPQQYGGQQQPYQQPPSGYPGQQQAWGQGQQGQQQEWGQNASGRAQPTQQWSGPPPGAQQWGPGFAPPDTGRPKSRSKLPLIIAGVVVVLLAAAGVLGFVTPGFFLTKVFDAAAVQQGVQRVLTDDYGLEGVTSVTCGENILVDAGATFECDATVDGSPVKVPVTVTDAEGAYEVGRPI